EGGGGGGRGRRGTDRGPGGQANRARHRREAARELHAEADPALEELADGVLTLGVGPEVDVEGVTEALRRVEEELLEGLGAVVRSARAGGDRPRRVAHVGGEGGRAPGGPTRLRPPRGGGGGALRPG